MDKKKALYAHISLIIVSAVWGSSFIVGKDIVASINPYAFVGHRMFIAGLLLLAVLLFIKKKVLFGWKKGILLGFFIGSALITQAVGITTTTASNSGFITGMFVVFVPAFSYFLFKRKSHWIKYVAVAINLLGLWFLTGGLKDFNRGDAFTVICALFVALHTLFVDKFSKEEGVDPLVLTAQQLLIAGLMGYAVAFFFGQPFISGTAKTFWQIGFMIIFPTLLAFAVQLKSQKYIPTVRASLIIALQPVFAALAAWTLGGETFVGVKAFGGLLIVAGMVVSELKH